MIAQQSLFIPAWGLYPYTIEGVATVKDKTDASLVNRTIVVRQKTDGTMCAEECLIHLPVGETAYVTSVPDTEQQLPLDKKNAEQWVNTVLGDLPDNERESWIAILCGEESPWAD